jgi:asparagine synthase (glutamine-hydrolysing)
MCGIFGQWMRFRDPPQREMLEAMAATLHHRGPDDRYLITNGQVGMGATRLALVDLAHGRQPLSNEDGTVWVCQNGEIYNYRELTNMLRGRGHSFRTSSDTEVLVHAYEEYGPSFIKHLRGMFAIALWDAKKEMLLLGRDPLGIKPLYYTSQPNAVFFASELKALLAAKVPRVVNPQAVSDYVSCNYIPGSQTIFQNIYKLPPGHLLFVTSAGVFRSRTWTYPETDPSFHESRKTAVHQVKTLLDQAVVRTLVSDVPVGAFLSGGVDSSAVVAMAAAHVPKLHTFSVGFSDRSFDELEYARRVSQHYGTTHHEIVLDIQDPSTILKSLETLDEPLADPSSIATYTMSAFARQQVKAVLSGDGGDEIFGGYTIYYTDQMLRWYRHVPASLRRGLAQFLTRVIPTVQTKTSWEFKLKRFLRGSVSNPVTAHFLWRAILTAQQKEHLLNPEFAKERPAERFWQDIVAQRSGADLLNDLMATDAQMNLVDDMLTKVDRMSMANSLEVRVPLLDQELVEYVAALPSSYKFHHWQLKTLLKEAVRGQLPSSIIDRPKAGFHVPMARWLRTSLRPWVEDYLSAGRLSELGYFQVPVVQQMITDHMSGKKDYHRELWGMIVLMIWHDNMLSR